MAFPPTGREARGAGRRGRARFSSGSRFFNIPKNISRRASEAENNGARTGSDDGRSTLEVVVPPPDIIDNTVNLRSFNRTRARGKRGANVERGGRWKTSWERDWKIDGRWISKSPCRIFWQNPFILLRRVRYLVSISPSPDKTSSRQLSVKHLYLKTRLERVAASFACRAHCAAGETGKWSWRTVAPLDKIYFSKEPPIPRRRNKRNGGERWWEGSAMSQNWKTRHAPTSNSTHAQGHRVS